MIEKGQIALPGDTVSAKDEIRDPYLLEFLDLKDEYSEGELEEALIRHLEWFLLELGAGFTFVARQKRIRIGDSWYRIDLLSSIVGSDVSSSSTSRPESSATRMPVR